MTAVAPLAAVFLVFLPVSVAPAQDSMQLDVEFKESLTRGAYRNEESRSAPRQRREPRAAQARVGGGKRSLPKHSEPSR
jgi:hypothetical protein